MKQLLAKILVSLHRRQAANDNTDLFATTIGALQTLRRDRDDLLALDMTDASLAAHVNRYSALKKIDQAEQMLLDDLAAEPINAHGTAVLFWSAVASWFARAAQ